MVLMSDGSGRSRMNDVVGWSGGGGWRAAASDSWHRHACVGVKF